MKIKNNQFYHRLIKKNLYPLNLAFFLIFFACLYILFLNLYLGMDGCWDTASYHYFNGWSLVHGQIYHYGALAGAQTFFNPVADALNYLTFQSSSYLGASYLSLIFLFILILLYKINSKFIDLYFSQNKILPILATIMGATAVSVVYKFGTFSNEHITALFFLLAFWLALKLYQPSPKSSDFFLSGLCAGLGVGLKLTLVPYVWGLWLGLLLTTKSKKRVLIIFSMASLLGYFLIEGPFWMLRWQYFHNPLFPFVNQLFHSPYLLPHYYKTLKHPFTFSNMGFYLSLPIRWLYSAPLSEVHELRDGRIFLGFMGVFCFIYDKIFVDKPNRMKIPPQVLMLLTTYLAGYMMWVVVFRIYRTLMVLDLLSGIVLMLGLIQLKLISIQKKLLSIGVLITTIIFLSIITVYPNSGRRSWQKHFINVHFPFPIANQLILFNGYPLSYLAPSLIEKKSDCKNINSQIWSERKTQDFLDVQPTILPNINNIYFIQYKNIPPNLSDQLRMATLNKQFICKTIMSNYRKTFMCHYFKSQGS